MKRTSITVAALCGMGMAALAGTARPMVEVARVGTCQDVLEKNLPGRAMAVANVDVFPNVAGTVVEAALRNGAPVKKGDLLYRIDDSGFKVKLQIAEARAEGCRVKLEAAKKGYERRQKLGGGGISQEALENAKSSMDAAQAEMKAVEADLALAKGDLAGCRIVAPIDGTVARVLKGVGDRVRSETVVASIVKLSPICVRFSLSEGEYLRMFGGRDSVASSNAVVSLTLSDGSAFPEEGRFERAEKFVDAASDSLQLYAQFPNLEGVLRPGAFVSVTLKDRRPIVRRVIPASAVAWDAKGPFVWVVDSENVVSRRPVECGRIDGGSRHVMGGLEEGERVVVSGVHKLASGMKVDVANEGTAK